MKYRKKPVIVEAVQFTKEMVLEKEPIPEGVTMGHKSWHPARGEIGSYRYYIETMEGKMDVRIGDWIITGVKGEKYPCARDVFEMSYEAV
jgi:hypothetical protein